MDWPNAQHVHVEWSRCLLCELDQRMQMWQLASAFARIVQVGGQLAEQLRQAFAPMVEAVDQLAVAMRMFSIALAESSAPLPSPLGPWYPGRFA